MTSNIVAFPGQTHKIASFIQSLQQTMNIIIESSPSISYIDLISKFWDNMILVIQLMLQVEKM